MPTHSGPNTLGESNLVFAYDTGDVKNSYIGEPTTNYLTTALAPNSATKESFSGTITENSEIAPDGTLTAHRYQVNSGYNYQVLTIPAYTTITYSVWIKMLNGVTSTSFGPYIWNYNSPTYGIVARDLSGVSPQWKRMTMTYTTQAHQSSFGLSYAATNGGMNGTYALWRPQLEYKSNATPFTTGTRSATQGLLPLIGNSTIDLSNVSFDSNAKMVFDGTNDVISIPTNSVFNTNIFSVESIFKLSTYDNQHRTIAARNASVYSHSNGWWMGTLRNGLGNNNNDFRVFFWGDSSYVTYNTSSGGNDGRYHHMVISCDGVTVFFYVDGQLAYSASKPSGNLYSSSENILIGQSPVGDNWSGTIPVAKIYNRALTAQEVRQNYQQYKTRFNLS